ncbi:NB-ARC domain-containing protein [Streptomyces sp. NPDC057445]|uniref:NB-ARC domain-containing protein n=1 Tax=Streptomyces sp. NPDC057445 TaxID=3346136 RepID=UPI0036994D5D
MGTGSSAESSGDRSIAAARSIRQALTGDHAVAMHVEKSLTLPPEAFELPQAPPHMVNLPERARLFIGRERELARLDEAFRDTGGVVVQAVHGLGGIGKSTLAARWCAGRAGAYNPVWWVTAETPADLESGLADMAVALQPALRDALSREALRELAVQWLSSHDGWLLVLDNVSDPADVKPLLGRATGGHFLITTRRATGWHGIAESLSLDVLELAQAVELFGRIHGGPVADVEELCGELGCLPLAVEQAAAYCVEARISPRAYLDLLARYPEQVFANRAEGGDAERTIARIWRVTLDRLADTPLAARILLVIAWWAPGGIPRAYLDALGGGPNVTEALRRLAAHSMISLHEDGTISVHRLVQAVARTGDPDDPHRRLADVVTARDAAAMLLMIDEELSASAAWVPHAEVLGRRLPPEHMSKAVVLLVEKIGSWHQARLSHARASEWYEIAMTAAEAWPEQDHELTLFTRRAFARQCGYMGDGERALALVRENLAMARRLYGRKDARTFAAAAALAAGMLDQGDLDGGMSLAVKNAKRAERVFGSTHRVTLHADGVLARGWALLAESDVDRYATRAADEIERRLDKAAEATDNAYEWVHALLWEFGSALMAAGDLAGAISATERAVELHSSRSDLRVRETLPDRSRLAMLLWDTGDLHRGRELAAALLTDAEHALGEAPYVQDLRELFSPLLAPDDT